MWQCTVCGPADDRLDLDGERREASGSEHPHERAGVRAGERVADQLERLLARLPVVGVEQSHRRTCGKCCTCVFTHVAREGASLPARLCNRIVS